MLAEFLDALGIEQADVVANDSGGAIAQIFAAGHPQRLRSLTLTNCDVHDNWPPPAIAPQIEAARKGTLIDAYANFIDQPEARRERFTRAYADPSVLTNETYRVYIDPLRSSEQRRDNFHRYWLAFDNRQTVAIEPRLRELRVPTLIVWGLDDIFFELKWAHWLKRTIPGARRVVEVPDAKLFFPEDRPQALAGPAAGVPCCALSICCSCASIWPRRCCLQTRRLARGASCTRPAERSPDRACRARCCQAAATGCSIDATASRSSTSASSCAPATGS